MRKTCCSQPVIHIKCSFRSSFLIHLSLTDCFLATKRGLGKKIHPLAHFGIRVCALSTFWNRDCAPRQAQIWVLPNQTLILLTHFDWNEHVLRFLIHTCAVYSSRRKCSCRVSIVCAYFVDLRFLCRKPAQRS